MPQAIWTGSISFGLVMLPVKLYPATSPKRVRFHEFDGSGRRIRHRRVIEEPQAGFGFGFDDLPIVAPAPDAPPRVAGSSPSWQEPAEDEPDRADRPVAYQDVMLGYEVAPGETVLLSRDEVRALAPERSRTIEIEDFVDLASIDPVHFEKSYYAVPQREAGAERAYALLARAMDDARMVGIGRIVLRTREHLAAIRPKDGAIVLETLFHGDEIRDTKELLAPTAVAEEPSQREVTMATQLIELLRAAWDPSRYGDRGRERLLDAIAAKAKDAGTIKPAEAEPTGADVSDLMETLRASVEAAKARAAEERAG